MNSATKHKYRKIDPRIWLDAHFRTWGDDGRLSFLFLLTHPLQSALGAMRGTLPGLAAELGWHERRFRDALALALAHGSVVIDEISALIWLPNFLKYNPPESVNVVKAWRGAFDSLPECALKHQIYQGVKAYADGMTEAFRLAFAHAIAEGSRVSYAIPGTVNSEQRTVNSDKDTPAADAALVVLPKKWADEIKAVNDHYHAHRPKSRQTADSKIKARLEEGFTVEDIKSAIDGYFNSEFHNGANERGKKFLNLELMVRDAKHIEDGKELLVTKPQPSKPASQITKSWSDPKDWEQFKETRNV